MKFTIDRKTWNRGCRDGNPSLLSASGMRCCVGFYLSACGVSDADLLSHLYFSAPLPQRAMWLIKNRDEADRDRLASVYSVNDSVGLDEVERERLLAELFAKHGEEVEFVG